MIELNNHLTLSKETCRALNLTSHFDDQDLHTIGEEVYRGYQADSLTRSKWEKRSEAAMDLAMQLQKSKSFPWPNCSNVAFPLVTIGAMQWHARAYPALVQGKNLVRCRTYGPDPDGSKRLRADRIGTHMSYQFMEEDGPWEEEHDRGLLALAVVGTIFKKTFFSSTRGHNRSELVMAKNLTLNYWSRSVEDCPRKTHDFPISRNEIRERILRKAFRDVREEEWFTQPPPPNTDNIGLTGAARADVRTGTTPPQPDDSTPFTAYEQHVDMDLDGDGYAEPYIITILKEDHRPVRIVTRFEWEQIEFNDEKQVVRVQPLEYFTKYGFIPSPDGGIYDIGFGSLLGPLNESVNSGINQMMDSGTMALLAGGFLGRGAKFRGGDNSFRPFSWNRVDSTGDDLAKSVMPLPVREASMVMFNLLVLLIDYTNRVSGSTDVNVGENPGQNTPKYNMQAMLQQGQMIYNAIFKRQWRCMRGEFKKAYILNAMYMDAAKSGGRSGIDISREDYLGDPRAIVPYADPNISSMEARVQQAVSLAQRAGMVAGYNRDEVEKLWLRSIQVESIELVYPGADKVPPLPNPKAQVEEMKGQIALKKEQIKFVEKLIEMQEKRDLTRAQIDGLKAQAAKALSEVGVARAGTLVQAFEAQVSALTEVDESIRGHIDQMIEMTLGEQKNANDAARGDARGMGGMAGGPSNKGSSARA